MLTNIQATLKEAGCVRIPQPDIVFKTPHDDSIFCVAARDYSEVQVINNGVITVCTDLPSLRKAVGL